MGAEGEGDGSMGYQREGGRTGTLTPFQVPESLTSARPPFHPPTTCPAMLLAVALYFAALVVAIAAVGRALAPPSVRLLDAGHRLSR